MSKKLMPNTSADYKCRLLVLANFWRFGVVCPCFTLAASPFPPLATPMSRRDALRGISVDRDRTHPCVSGLLRLFSNQHEVD